MQQYIFYFEPQDAQEFMSQVGWKLSNGKLPDTNSDELILTQKLLQNKDLKIGDKFGLDLDRSELLLGEHSITGSIQQSSNLQGGIGLLGATQNEKDEGFTFFVKPVDAAKIDLRNKFKRLEKDFKSLQIRTDQTEQVYYEQSYKIISELIWA